MLKIYITKNKSKMGTKALYMDNCYLKEFKARVIDVYESNFIALKLDQTAFYPTSGGIPCDKGKFIVNSDQVKVSEVYKRNNEVWHVVNKKIEKGTEVKGIIDWERRYKLMRYHTADHLISALLFRKFNAMITGNQTYVDYSRIDFNLEKFDKELLKQIIDEANEIIKKGKEVKIYYLDKQEAMKIPGIIKLASKMPPDAEKPRIVEIPGIDIQADGGCHVKNIKEIGKLEFIKAENKGKANRRLYFRIVD